MLFLHNHINPKYVSYYGADSVMVCLPDRVVHRGSSQFGLMTPFLT